MTDGVNAWRDEFPVTKACIYFDHAGVAPVSRRVAEAVEQFIREALDSGRLNYGAWEARAEEIRATFAQLIGATPEEIAFVGNTSEGLAIVATGLTWQRGDNVVAVSGEFPANVYPWWSLEGQGVETRMASLEDFRLTVGSVDRCVDSRTRLLSVSAVDFATGQRRPLRELGDYCRRRGIIFCVDAIQAVGAVTVDVERDLIDCLAADGHKWLCAPEGCGCLYVSRRMWDKIRPQRVGWKSVIDHSRYLPYHFTMKPDALRFEPGSLNLLSIHALGAALDLLLGIGMETVEKTVLALTSRLRGGLEKRGFDLVSPGGPDELSGITTFRGLRDPSTAEKKFRARNILLRERLAGLRISPHFYCCEEDIGRFFSALDEIRES